MILAAREQKTGLFVWRLQKWGTDMGRTQRTNPAWQNRSAGLAGGAQLDVFLPDELHLTLCHPL